MPFDKPLLVYPQPGLSGKRGRESLLGLSKKTTPVPLYVAAASQVAAPESMKLSAPAGGTMTVGLRTLLQSRL
jgi:hypothetical protein